MFRRQPGKSDATDASAYSRRSAVADSVWAAQDRLRGGIAGAGHRFADIAVWPLERASYALRKKVIWPAGGPGREDGHAGPRTRQRHRRPARRRSRRRRADLGRARRAPQRRRHDRRGGELGAPGGGEGHAGEARRAHPAGRHPRLQADQGGGRLRGRPGQGDRQIGPGGQTSSTTTAAASSAASASTAPASSTASSPARPASVDGPPAGPRAIAVAGDFAGAFVLYETGDSDSGVRRAFGETATPALAKALLRRPPRLPANVKVPKAKVVNVVPAPSHGDIYPSASRCCGSA